MWHERIDLSRNQSRTNARIGLRAESKTLQIGSHRAGTGLRTLGRERTSEDAAIADGLSA